MRTLRDGKLYIQKRAFPEWATLYLVILPFVLSFLLDLLSLPSFIKYTADLAWVAVSFITISKRRQHVHKNLMPFVVFFGCWLASVAIVYLFRFQSPVYFLWGFRNNARYFIAFILFAYYLKVDDVKSCLKFIDFMFIIHIMVTFFQFFIMGYQWDYLGGIFGVQLGGNGNSLVFLVIVCSKSLIMYMNDQESVWKCFFKCGISLVIATMSEIKVFFLIFVVIVLVSSLITKFSWKKIPLFIFGAVLIFTAGNLFTVIWGEDAALTLDRITELVTSTQYSSEKDLGRFTAIPTLSNTILTDPIDRWFGLGLGNCDTSSFALCNTPFYQSHSYLNYDWFSSAMTFLETGYVGLILFLSFFIVVFIFARKAKKTMENPTYYQLAMVMSVICIILVFYNSSLRMEIGYVAYFVLALPFVSYGSNKTQKEELPKQQLL